MARPLRFARSQPRHPQAKPKDPAYLPGCGILRYAQDDSLNAGSGPKLPGGSDGAPGQWGMKGTKCRASAATQPIMIGWARRIVIRLEGPAHARGPTQN